jgi:hypothetical protein
VDTPLLVELIPDSELGGFTARIPDIPAYGEGETEDEAIGDLEEAVRSKYWNELFPRCLWPHPFTLHSLNFSLIWPILKPIEDVVAEVK